MTNKVAIQSQGTRIEISLEDIVSRINNILATLKSLHESNVKAIETKALYWLEPTINESWFTIDLQHKQLADCEDLFDHNALGTVIETCERIALAASIGQSTLESQFVYEIRDTQPGYYRFIMAKMVTSEKCQQCHKLYTKGGMTSHIGSLRCLRDAQCIDVAEMGYVIMDDSAAVSAIRKAGVDFKVRPSALDMWVPAWVSQAVKDYRKNKDFAGLKLYEFLRAVKGGND